MMSRLVRRGWQAYRARCLDPVQARSAGLYSLLAGHWLRPPYKRSTLHVCRGGALGDVLLCTPAVRAVWRRNPAVRVIFYTEYQELLRGLPFIHDVRPTSEAPPEAISLRYEHCLPPKRHIAHIFAEQLGIRLTSVLPTCAVDQAIFARQKALTATWGRPMVVVNRRAGPWTPNKDWPAVRWDELLIGLCRVGTVVEIGQPSTDDPPAHCPNYHDLRGRTTLSEMTAVLAAADLHVGPMSGPVHLAAAFRVPSVVIYGGYEAPVCSEYPGNINLVNQPECSPCWLRTPCPHDRQCLWAITPQAVLTAVHSLLRR